VFFPYLGIIDKIKQCDTFIFLDDVQFEAGGFQNRNKILTKDGVKWLTVPLKRPNYKMNLQQIEINYDTDWQYNMLGQLKYSYGKCPFFQEVFDLVNRLFGNKYQYLVELNIASMILLMQYFNIKCLVDYSSKYPDKPNENNDRIVYLTKQSGRKTYLSGINGKEYIDLNKFQDISLVYQEFAIKEYEQKWSDLFVPYMSVLDYMMQMGNSEYAFS
jgi:hypothetical protein